MDKTKKGSKLSANIDQLTKQGNDELQQANLGKAVEAFELAFQQSIALGSPFTQRACAFNLGAVQVASGNILRGLEMLQRALPPNGKKDGKSNGDLFYNFGLAYEALTETGEAVKFYELALEDYQSEGDNFVMEADASSKAGNLYESLKSWLSAARCYGIAAKAHEKLKDYENESVCMCHQATSLFQGQRSIDAVQIADECMIRSQRVTHADTLGKLYNELGLTYTQCHEFAKAAACFELALPLSRGPKGDKKREAVILQNLGAVYNSLGDFDRSLGFHESAGAKHAELGNRGSQGQCFTNKAYAYSQLGDNEGAGECYLHALQAARDTDDKHAQWQAMEGLGAVAFNARQWDRAVRYFKEALATLTATETNATAQERIVAKLTDALQYQFVKDSHGSGGKQKNGYETISPVNVLVNGAPRPPTRDEMRQLEDFRQLRNRKRFHRQRVPQEHKLVALGVGEYDTDSDYSVRKLRRRPSSRKESRKWKAQGRHHRYRASTSVDGNKGDISPKSVKLQNSRDPRLTNSEPNINQAAPSRKPSRRLSRQKRFPSEPRNPNMRRNKRPLLRSNSFDSETEWKNKMRELSDFSTSDEEYRERLFPPSTDSEQTESEFSEKNHKRHERKHKNQLEKLTNVLAKALIGDGSESESQLEEPVPTRGRALTKSHDHRSRSHDKKTRSDESSTRSRPIHSRSKSEPGRQLKKLKNKRPETATETESDSETVVGSETETDSDDVREAVKVARMKADLRGALTPPPVPSPLTLTYESPVAGMPPGAGALMPPGANFFRNPGQPQGGTQVHFRDNQEGDLMVTNSLYGGTGKTFKDDEPVYQTIRSVKSTMKSQNGEPQPGLSKPAVEVEEEGPPLPPRNEQLDQLEENGGHQEMRNGNSRDENATPLNSSVELPQRKSQEKSTSRMCVLM